MSSFTNVTDGDLELQVDGVSVHAPAGDVFTIPNEFDSQLKDQPAFTKTKKADKSDATEEKK